ncbi:MAG: aspartate-semialdehyde dehydrogenase [Fimbriimonadales bacterium]|nr:aspartate-semialdehyde dehydrogenase [Fimbriimonadales bacterium]MDW8051990.1 aspartate-semialdehyde dehydrogenase [Armatimonadota bacterium]
MSYRVAIVGATGAVGQELLQILEQRQFPISELRLFASERSVGKTLLFRGEAIPVHALRPDSFKGVDFAFFSAGASRSKEFAPIAVQSGAAVIDNSSAFRMEPNVPLVIPEINPDALRHHAGIIANPNCSTIIMLMALEPLRRLARIRRIVVSTYQAASGAGAQAMQELLESTRAYLQGEPFQPRVLPHPYAFNLFSHNSPIGEDGYNEEERKMIVETRKIWGDPEVAVSPTCIRVPVLRAHSESLVVELETRPPLEAIYTAYQRFPGVQLVDDRPHNHFPMPIEATGRDEVLVGRIRYDLGTPDGVALFACGDQLRKGAALNAVQIAEHLIGRAPTP